MSPRTLNYPFTAVSGMDGPKRALLCSLINPRLRTVLIRGRRGTGKTVLSRSLEEISSRRMINIPANVSQEQLFGGMDVDIAIRDGRLVLKEGLIAQGDGNILYVDNINLMDNAMAIALLDSVREGLVRVESEGISAEYPIETTLVATMDPEECDICSHLLDRFDMCAYSNRNEDADVCRSILRSNSEYREDPSGFVEGSSEDTRKVHGTIDRSKEVLPLVTFSDELIDVCVELCAHVGAHGFRGDIALIETAMTLSALDNRDIVTKADVEEAAKLCLVHRRDYSAPPPDTEPPEDDDKGDGPDEDGNDDRQDGKDNSDDGERDDKSMEDFSRMLQDLLFEIGEEFRVIDYLKGSRTKIRETSSRKGRREMAMSKDTSGRYISSKIPEGRIRDIAFDATIRAAAPYQRSRGNNGLSFNIQKQDIRVKVRERRSGCTILFLVDASGSLGVRKRMSAVKGAIMSMLKDSYVRRDRIGLMEFRRDSAELILPPTRSVEYSFRLLEELPTGGRTPLGQALITVSEYMGSYARSHKGERCHVVLVTDGHANVSLSKGVDASEEARRIASDIHVPNLGWIVIDASARYSGLDDAELLAMELGGTYLKLESLNADRIAENVRSLIV